MTDLQRIEIEGFKGIERLEYEPSGMNLITGRNNTGKTSLLEAIALAFDPTYVKEFGEDIDSLIHRDFEECRIAVETEEEKREMEIRRPTADEVKEYFTPSMTSSLTESFSVRLDSEEGEQVVWLSKTDDNGVVWSSDAEDGEPVWSSDTGENAGNLVSGTVSGTIDRHLAKRPLVGLEEESLVFTIDGDEYPFIVFGNAAVEVVQESAEQLAEKVGERVLGENSGFDATRNLNQGRRLSHPSRIGAVTNQGFQKTPPTSDATTFIKSKNLLSAPEFEPDSGDAIKRDDLGDYLEETGLADELKTFNLDELVFQKKGGEKYSVPYDFMGDGFKTIVGLLWELMDDEVEDQIVLLEEPENHMHPGYVRKVIYFLVELAKDENVQLFITTHNKDFIDTFFTENLTDEEVEFLEDEFTLVRMESHSVVVEDYETARENVEDLHLDLRGI